MARVSQKEKDQSRARIVGSAARLMRERGIDGASVGDVMKDAGLTHGGFYRHFADKAALVDSALAAAFEEILAHVEGDVAVPERRARFRKFYLSRDHLRNQGLGCPAAALASELGRAPRTNQAAFSDGVRRIISALSGEANGFGNADHTEAARELAMLVGAVSIARAGDPALATLMLNACQSAD